MKTSLGLSTGASPKAAELNPAPIPCLRAIPHVPIRQRRLCPTPAYPRLHVAVYGDESFAEEDEDGRHGRDAVVAALADLHHHLEPVGRLLVAEGGHLVGAAGWEPPAGSIERGQRGPRGEAAAAFPLDAALRPVPRGADLLRGTPCLLADEAPGRVAVAFGGAVVGGDGLTHLRRKKRGGEAT